MSTRTGRRCILLGNPPKHKSFSSGDSFDGCAIAVSDAVKEYHAPGSVSKDGQQAYYHIYVRTKAGGDTFRYNRSVINHLDKRDPVGDKGRLSDLGGRGSDFLRNFGRN